MAGRKQHAPRVLRLLPEWLGQSGLWLAAPDGSFEPVGAEDIGLSEEIADRLEDWMDEFDSIFEDGDPLASAFGTVAQFEAWRREGDAIAGAIRSALGPNDRIEVLLPVGLGPK